MNWLRTILDGVIVCIAFNGVVAFVWLLEPIGFSVMLPNGISTPLQKLTKAQIRPIRLMELILYPILLAYIIISAYEAGVTGFWNLFFSRSSKISFGISGISSCWIGGFVPNLRTG